MGGAWEAKPWIDFLMDLDLFRVQARDLVPERAIEVARRWARDQIATLRPERALAILECALARAHEGAARQELIAMQEEAWFASYPA